jgi:probable HAF family extracellular repeat protein
MIQKNKTTLRAPAMTLNPVFLACALCVSAAVHAQGVSDLGVLNGGTNSQGIGINAAGNVAVGSATDGAAGNAVTAFRWTPAGGYVGLGMLNGGNQSNAYAVNAQGDVVVGMAADGAAGNQLRAYRWTQGTGMVSLGVLNGGIETQAFAVNAAGDVVVGSAKDGAAANFTRAFRWTQAGGLVSLGLLNGGSFANAYGINAAGDVVAGVAADGAAANEQRAFRWTQAGGIVNLGTLNGGNSSVARDINTAGDVVVGYSADGAAANAERAFRWTQIGGMVNLGVINGGNASRAYGVDSTGSVVVGRAADGAAANAFRGFRWTQATGMQSIEAWLAAGGVVVNPAAAKTAIAFGTNSDGSVVVGTLDNNHAYLARVTAAGVDGTAGAAGVTGAGGAGGAAAGNGMIDLVQYNQSLAASVGAPAIALQAADVALHGAHGSPMRGLLANGSQSFSVAGDVGRGSAASSSTGDLGVAEVSYARGLRDGAMIKVALGHSRSSQDTAFGGNTRVSGTYLLPEVIFRLADSPVHFTVSGYYNAGNATLKRGYTNAGTAVVSQGDAQAATTALRIRADWLNAATWGGTAFTPYASLTQIHSRLGTYTETGGGFPAFWEARSESATQARIGVDAVHSISDQLSLLGRVEVGHRFQSQGANAKGQVLGLFAFDLSGQPYKQDWARVSAGIEGKFGDGVGSLVLNASTEGQTPRYLLAANYRWSF